MMTEKFWKLQVWNCRQINKVSFCSTNIAEPAKLGDDPLEDQFVNSEDTSRRLCVGSAEAEAKAKAEDSSTPMMKLTRILTKVEKEIEASPRERNTVAG